MGAKRTSIAGEVRALRKEVALLTQELRRHIAVAHSIGSSGIDVMPGPRQTFPSSVSISDDGKAVLPETSGPKRRRPAAPKPGAWSKARRAKLEALDRLLELLRAETIKSISVVDQKLRDVASAMRKEAMRQQALESVARDALPPVVADA